MQLKKGGKEKVENQIPTRQVSSKRLKICHISDTHGHHHDLVVPECDVLVCSGDISMLGQRNEVEDFFNWFNRLAQCTYKILVAGNHDITFDPDRGGNNGYKPQWLINLINKFTEHHNSYINFYLENSSCNIEGVKFWGSPASSWFHGDKWAFNLREKEEKELYSTIPLGTDVVITHGPARWWGDYCNDIAGPVGSEALEYHIRRVKPLLHLFGHIHESYGYEESSFDTYFFNGCNCTLQYQIGNKPWLIDADFDNKEVEVLNERV